MRPSSQTSAPTPPPPHPPDSAIVCPQCGCDFPLTDALARRVEERVRASYVARERELREQDAELRRQREGLDAEVELRLREGADKLRREAQKLAEDALGAKLRALTESEGGLRARLRDSEQAQLDLLKEKRALADQKEALELHVARTLDEERGQIREAARRQADEAALLTLRQREKLIADLTGQIEDLKRRAEQGSQQAQGEILEVELENLLARNFPHDRVEPVAKGKRGADVVQHVTTASGQVCGTILWESKRTRAWSNDWLDKLRRDQRDAKADLAALVSVVLPKELRHFGEVEGVWVCDFPTAVGVAASLRMALVERAQAREALSGRVEKKELIYRYLASPAFRQRIEGLVATFQAMKRDLVQERAAVQKLWAKREQQIDQFMEHTARMYGEMQGILGRGLPEVVGMSLGAAEQLPLLAPPDDSRG